MHQAFNAEDLNDKALGWKKKVHQQAFKDGYKTTVYQRKQKGQAGDLLRIEGEFQNITVAEVVDYYLNPPTDGGVYKDFKTLEKMDNGDVIIYFRIGMPMMSDRDNVLHSSMKEIDGGTFLNMRTVDHPAAPQVAKVVRMYNHILTYLKQEGDNVTMLDFEYLNLKGYLPASLMNMAIASETAKEFKNMMNYIYAK